MPKRKKKSLDDVNRIVDEIEQREKQKNTLITSTIAERIGEIGLLAPAEVLTLSQLRRTQDDIAFIESVIEQARNEQIQAIKEAVRTSAEVTYNSTRETIEQAKNSYSTANQTAEHAEKIAELPPLTENESVEKVIEQAEKQAVDSFKNEYRTQAFMLRDRANPQNLIPTPLSKAYQSAVDEAAQAIITSGERWEKEGKSTNYTTVMRQTVKQLADSGVRVVVVRKAGTETNKAAYESERLRYHTQRLDTAVRRNVLDSVRMVNQNVQNEVGKQIGSDGVEITVHRYPAPDHALVQGHQFTNEEFEKMQSGYDCKDIQGRSYTGFKRPIGMWNCRHFTISILCGVFPQTYSDEQLRQILDENDKGYTLPNGKHLTMYECTQYQRKYETAIRYAKEGKNTAEKARDGQLADEFRAKTAQLIKEYRAFSNACGLKPKMDRTYVSGYTVDDSRKAVESPDEFSKDYRPVVLNENDTKEVVRPSAVFNVYKSENTVNNIYVSEGNKSIKRKELHQIDTKLTDVLKLMNISEHKNLPTIYIINSQEMNKNAIAAYRASDNSLFIDSKFAIYKKDNVPEAVKGFACPNDDRSTFAHELFHWKDAQDFRNKYGEITKENYGKFESFVQNNAKKYLDKIQEKGHNIFVSDYGEEQYGLNKFDETYTEYRVLKLLGDV